MVLSIRRHDISGAGLGIMMDNATAYGSTYVIIQFIKNLELL